MAHFFGFNSLGEAADLAFHYGGSLSVDDAMYYILATESRRSLGSLIGDEAFLRRS